MENYGLGKQVLAGISFCNVVEDDEGQASLKFDAAQLVGSLIGKVVVAAVGFVL